MAKRLNSEDHSIKVGQLWKQMDCLNLGVFQVLELIPYYGISDIVLSPKDGKPIEQKTKQKVNYVLLRKVPDNEVENTFAMSTHGANFLATVEDMTKVIITSNLEDNGQMVVRAHRMWYLFRDV